MTLWFDFLFSKFHQSPHDEIFSSVHCTALRRKQNSMAATYCAHGVPMYFFGPCSWCPLDIQGTTHNPWDGEEYTCTRKGTQPVGMGCLQMLYGSCWGITVQISGALRKVFCWGGWRTTALKVTLSFIGYVHLYVLLFQCITMLCLYC